ncbi:MAG: NUDIX domain-containing protein [Acidimicrobiales bacterium]
MPSPQSSGLLLYRWQGERVQLLIAHMGGPYWAKKHEHAWSVPKGLHEADEVDALAVAEREFAEEMGSPPPSGPTLDLGSKRASGKTLTIFAREGDFDETSIVSNHFELEWPPRSGQIRSFPEVDRVAWVDDDEARQLLVKGQVEFVDRLLAAVSPR